MLTRGFSVGVLQIQWRSEPPSTQERGLLYPATLTSIETESKSIRRDLVGAALSGVVVTSPHGHLSRIVDVESYATNGLGVGAPLGLLLKAVDA